ncbi:ABC transporter ATP-binding protein [Cetobacterium sp.]|uniref:ABC transporter ATP-binding protein n=1 Tax=Cetobacterium sp. TaxID=2071632 RepID=UPI003F31947A
MIVIKDLNKTYKNENISLHVLKNINLHINKGEFVAITGSSGSGKSTLMNIMGCLDSSFNGFYSLNNINILNLDDKKISFLRNNNIGFVFQSFNLLKNITAIKNVELPLTYTKISKKERIIKAFSALKSVGLEERINHLPNQLSGGQNQRVAIARAIVNDPDLILADEPTGNLDSVSEDEIMNIFSKLNKMGKTIVVVTHNEEVLKFCKRKIILKDGIIIKDETR